MAPVVDMNKLTELVRETGIEFITHSGSIRRAWEDIAKKYCEDMGLEPIHYKVFSVRWKNQKFYSKKKALIQQLGISHKQYVSSKAKILEESPSSKDNPPSSIIDPLSQNRTMNCSSFMDNEEQRLRIEEIRQRMKFNQEIFSLQKEKLQLEIERARLALKQEDDQEEMEEESHTSFLIA